MIDKKQIGQPKLCCDTVIEGGTIVVACPLLLPILRSIILSCRLIRTHLFRGWFVTNYSPEIQLNRK